jgi:hypothetical protein
MAVIVAILAFCGGALQAVETGRQPEPDLKGVRILVCASYFDLMNIPAIGKLAAAGAEVRAGQLDALTWNIARKFHVIIAVDEQLPRKPVGSEGPVETLARFAGSGGGVFFFCQSTSAKEDVNRYLAPFGASLPRELLRDPQHAFQCPTGFNLSYAYTTNVAAGHPITERVKGIWYSADLLDFATSSIEVSKDWTPLVSGETSATTVVIPQGLLQGERPDEHGLRPGRFQTSPPIFAARQFGSGAIVLTGISPMEAFYGQGLPAYQDIMMKNGDGLRPSDFGRLYANALGWLAAYGKRAGGLGQGELEPQENSWFHRPTIDWSKVDLGRDACTRPIKGVIGLHSTLSDGHATPEALIAQARQSGLQWVAFTEKLEDLAAGPWNPHAIQGGMMASFTERNATASPDKWEQLRKLCREASTADFAVLPGLDYADNTGDRWVAFGDFEWPPERVFSADRKRLVQPTWWFTVGMLPNGPYDAGHNHLRPWDCSLYNLWPVRTTLAGKRVDEAAAAFRYVQGVQDDPFPVAVDMVYDADQLHAASGRACNYLTVDKPGDLTKLFRRRSYYGSWQGFVSDGPIVTDWRMFNATRNSGEQWYLPSTERYRVKLSVRSEVPIRDIKIYDGPHLFARFCPGQAKVTIQFDAPHDKQHNLFAQITDAAGKVAITGGYDIRDSLNWRFMCGDRGNSICDAIQTDATGPYLMGPTAPYQRKMAASGLCAGYGTHHFNILPPNFDGGMRPIGMYVIPDLRIAGLRLKPPEGVWESQIAIPVSSRDGLLQADLLTGYFPGPTSAWAPKLAPIDIQDVKISYRYLDITPRAGDPGVILLEGRIGFAKSLTVQGLGVFSVFHRSSPGEGDHYAIVTPDQNVSGLGQATPFQATAAMAPGSYVMAFPSLWGSTGAMALDEGYVGTVAAKSSSVHLGVSLGNMPRHVQAGEEIRYRLILMHGRPGELANTADWEQMAKKMGLRGRPAYEVKDVKAGRVKGTKFLLELEPSEGGFSGTITAADLPIRLPIRVAEMNPNWTFAYFDLDRKQWLPSAVDQEIRQGYITLDTRRGSHRIFAGHPVLADNQELRILVSSDGRSHVQASVNNVGDTTVDAAVRLNPALGKAEPVKIRLEPGAVTKVVFSWK